MHRSLPRRCKTERWIWAAITCLLLLAHAPLFATDVSGDIGVNTQWTTAASPYNVTGTVRVTGGATLTIEPGVVVFMGLNTGLEVFGGRLLALGTAASPILFSSVNDQSGAPASPSPGDWQQFQILSGSGQTASRLDFVAIRFGLGMRIDNASPVLESTVLEDNLGPAISLDLRSSPSGTVSAARNAINGIVVPAGDVTQQTRWSLLGVPYVINAGIVHVGPRPPPITLSPASRFLAPGESSDFLVSLSEPAQVATSVTMTSSLPSVVTVDPTVIIDAGSFSALANLQAISGGSAIVTASAGSDSAVAAVTVAAQPQLILPTSRSVSAGRVRSVELSRSPASSYIEPVTVTLLANPDGIVQVPPTAIIPAGAASVNFNVTGIAEGGTTVTASAIGYTEDSSMVNVLPLTMAWPSPLVVPIGTINARLTFSDVAPAGGMTVNFESANPAVLSVPSSLPVPAGATGLNVPLTGHQEGSVTLTASNASYGQAVTGATVEQTAISFDVGTRTLPAGFTEPFTLNLSQPAGQGGVVVNLAAVDPTVASATPASVTIAAGQRTAAIQVSGLIEGATAIQASGVNLTPGELALTVGPQAELEFASLENTVGRGLRSRTSRIQLRMDGAAFRPRRNVQVSFNNADPASVSLPDSVTILAGAFQTDVATVGNLVTAAPIAVGAQASEVLATAAPLQVSVVEPTLTFEGLDGTRSLLSERDNFFLQWQVPGVVEQQSAATNQVFELSVFEPAPANVVDGIYEFSSTGGMTTSTQISEGGWTSAMRWVGVPNTFGTYRLRASLAGYDPWISAEQRSAGQNLVFSVPSFVAGKFTESNFVKIKRQQGGEPYAPNTSLTVVLSVSDPSRVMTNGVVVIPANSSQVSVVITGKELTAATLINATATGYESAPPLSVSVVEPEYQFAGLDGTRVPGATRDQFTLAFQVPGSAHVAQTPRLVVADVEMINPDPPNIVDGIYRSSTGGSPSTFIDYQFGTMTVVGYVGSPTATGSYAIRASVRGLTGSLDSVVQTVTSNTLRFDQSEVVVGQGLRVNTRLRLPSPPASPPVIIQMSCANGNCSSPTPVELYGTPIDVDVAGESLGTDTLLADAAPAPYGSASIPVTVQALAGSFMFHPGDGECVGGWYINVGPGVANEDLIAAISIIDQNPPGIYSGTHELTIHEGQSESESCFGLLLAPSTSAGTYRLRATIGTLGSFDSELVTAVTAQLDVSPPALIAARGLDSLIYVYSSLTQSMDVSLGAACSSADICVPQLPWTIPGFSTEGEFKLRGGVTGLTTLTVSAAGFPDASIDVEVREPRIVMFVGPGVVQVGQNLAIDLAIAPVDSFYDVYAPAPIDLTLIGDGPVALVPATLEISEGGNSVQFDLQAVQPGTFSFTVDWPGVGVFVSPTITVTP